MKKFFAAMFAIALGMAIGHFGPKIYDEVNRTFEYRRGIDHTEVLADYDDENKEGGVYYRVILWDEEFEYGRVVREGYAQKDELASLCDEAHAAEPYLGNPLTARF